MVDADTFVEGIELALGDLVDTISGKMLLTRKPWQSEKQHYRNVFIWSWPLFRLLLIVNNTEFAWCFFLRVSSCSVPVK